VNCKLCGVESKKKYTLNGSRTKLNIEVSFCKNCSAHFCEVADYDYVATSEDIIKYYENSQEYIRLRQKKIFKYVQEKFFKQPGAFIDIGSGIGYSLKVAQELGWHALGIEPSVILEEYSRNMLNLDTINGYLSKDIIATIQSKLPFDFADYILIDNVLEHIPEPVEFLQNALTLLRPGGLLLIAIPPVDWLRLGLASIPSIRQNSMSAQINLFYDPEQHVNYFSRKAMKILTEKVGRCKLTGFRFHHSSLLNNWIARMLGFETGYYFIVKDAS
jgi:SAM-dependent methyltransferase